MKHTFDVEIAKEVGVNSAVIYENILFWCLKNKANNSNFHDGNYWTYNSIKAWKELFPYMGDKAIRNALKKLEDHGFIASGNYNASGYDRTRWYGLIDLSKRANGTCQKGEPIPDNKPDNKPYIKEKEKEKEKYADGLNKKAFSQWCEYKGNKYSRQGKVLSANKLAKYDEATQQEMVNESIMNGWKGLFGPKQQKTVKSSNVTNDTINRFFEQQQIGEIIDARID